MCAPVLDSVGARGQRPVPVSERRRRRRRYDRTAAAASLCPRHHACGWRRQAGTARRQRARRGGRVWPGSDVGGRFKRAQGGLCCAAFWPTSRAACQAAVQEQRGALSPCAPVSARISYTVSGRGKMRSCGPRQSPAPVWHACESGAGECTRDTTLVPAWPAARLRRPRPLRLRRRRAPPSCCWCLCGSRAPPAPWAGT